jgi:tetratricopeptide (TPR) repeat protein
VKSLLRVALGAAFLLALIVASGCGTDAASRRDLAQAHYKLGDSRLKQGRGIDEEMNRRAAYPEIRKAIELDPDNPVYRIALGNIYLYDRKYDLAREQYLDALRLEPGNPFAHQNLGQVFWAEKKYLEAVREYDLALGNYAYPSPAFAHFNKGRAFLGLEDWNRAIESFRAALEIVPNLEGGWYLLGMALEKEGRLAEAERAFRKALEINADSARTRYDLGLVLSRQKRNAEAAAEFKRVTELDPDGDLGKYAARYLSILK